MSGESWKSEYLKSSPNNSDGGWLVTKSGFPNATQSVFHRLAALASPESLLERQIQEFGVGLRIWCLFTSVLGDSYGG